MEIYPVKHVRFNEPVNVAGKTLMSISSTDKVQITFKSKFQVYEIFNKDRKSLVIVHPANVRHADIDTKTKASIRRVSEKKEAETKDNKKTPESVIQTTD